MGLTDTHYYIYKIDKQQGPTVEHRELYYLVITYNGKESEIYIYNTEHIQLICVYN